MTTTSTIRTVDAHDRRLGLERTTEIHGYARWRFSLADPNDMKLFRELLVDGGMDEWIQDELASLANVPHVSRAPWTVKAGEGWLEFQGEVEDWDSVWDSVDEEAA